MEKVREEEEKGEKKNREEEEEEEEEEKKKEKKKKTKKDQERPTDPQLCLLYLNLGLSGPSSLFSKTTISLDALKSKIAYTYDCATIQLPKRQLPWGPLTP